MSLTDRVVLITGATGGTGRAAARTFAAAGARLGLVGRDRGRLDELAADLRLPAGRLATATADLRRPAEAAEAVSQVEGRLGPIEVLLHLVGGWSGGPKVTELEPADVGAMLDQHLWTTLHVARAVLPGMVERGWGRLIAVSSTVAQEGMAGQAAYAAAKAAQEALARTLAREVSGTGVTANVLVVRKIDVEHERDREPSARNATWTTPEELAATMLFLCSDEASAVNGARIPLTGRG